MTQGLGALVAPLLRLDIFQGLSQEQLLGIARRAERIIYAPGDTIMARDTEGDAAILIVSGDAVCLEAPGLADEIQPIEEGSLLGEIVMLIDADYSSTVIARGQVRALRINRDELQDQMERDPSLANHFLDKLAGRLAGIAKELRAVDTMLAGSAEQIVERQISESAGEVAVLH